MPTEAAEDWMMPVKIAPTITPRNGLVKAVRMEVNSGISAKGLTASFIISMPVISRAKPTIPRAYRANTMPVRAEDSGVKLPPSKRTRMMGTPKTENRALRGSRSRTVLSTTPPT